MIQNSFNDYLKYFVVNYGTTKPIYETVLCESEISTINKLIEMDIIHKTQTIKNKQIINIYYLKYTMEELKEKGILK